MLLEVVCTNEKCKKTEEFIVKSEEELPKFCSACNSKVEKVEFYSTGFQLKSGGVGWARNGYSNNYRNMGK